MKINEYTSTILYSEQIEAHKKIYGCISDSWWLGDVQDQSEICSNFGLVELCQEMNDIMSAGKKLKKRIFKCLVKTYHFIEENTVYT